MLFSSGDSEAGISPFATFCTVIGYRVGTANVAGVAVAIWSGGPGAVFWMLITSILDTAISYAECALGQVYKIKQDGEYRGGAYYYIQRGLGLKPIALIYALLTLICVPILTVAPHAFSITSGFKNSLGISQYVTGAIVAVLLFIVISGGIRRIAKTAEMVVPFMTIGFVILTVIVIVMRIGEVPAALEYDRERCIRDPMQIFGGLMGTAVLWGVKKIRKLIRSRNGRSRTGSIRNRVSSSGCSGISESLSLYILMYSYVSVLHSLLS